jgi:hypothetical protein
MAMWSSRFLAIIFDPVWHAAAPESTPEDEAAAALYPLADRHVHARPASLPRRQTQRGEVIEDGAA